MPTVTLLDLAKLKNGSDGALHLVEAVGKAAPEVLAMPARTIKGTEYDITIVTAFPKTGFRKINGGIDTSGATFEQRKAQCFILDARIEVDKAAARSHDKGPDALMATYSALTAKSSILTIGQQIFYGTALDGSGFPGMKELVTDALTLDAGGTTADTGTSVYMVFEGEMGVELVFGEDSTFDLQPFFDGEGEDANGKKFPAHVSYLNCRPGLSVASPFAIGRIKNLTNDAGKGLTDAKLSELLEKFPMDSQPTAIYMNRRARGQLQRSRTVTLQGNGKGGAVGGAGGNVAPIPTHSIDGIPIVCTDSILNTEAIA
jgi:hypothetical protein